MPPPTLHQKLQGYIAEHSNLDQHREYLGMSGIAGCPRVLYHQFFSGIAVNEVGQRNSFRGYFFEGKLKEILKSLNAFKPGSERELVAPVDSRFRGHTDGEDLHGNLMEIKSVSGRNFDWQKSNNKLAFTKYVQVQMYLRYGDYKAATVVSFCNETFEFDVRTVLPNPKVQGEMESKAIMILDGIDSGVAPLCTCGRCK